MNPIRNFIKAAVLTILFANLVSCQEDEEIVVTEQEEVQLINQSASVESLSDEELQTIEAEVAANPDGGRKNGTKSCVEVTRDESAKTITLDFGDGCTGPYGRERSGKIIITYGGTFGDNLANRVISFDNYFVNGKQITGTIELGNFNVDENGNPTATRTRNDFTVHFPDGNSFTVNGSTTITWLEGFGDEDHTNNVFSVTGSYEGESSGGRKVTHEIIEPVIVNVACGLSGSFARVQGVTEMHVEGVARERVRTVNYGNGDCDKTIHVTINGRTREVTIS